ncbi:ubiquitin [Plasmodium gonderi]|uniref:Ubiquitin n=1 Tax=Plasmodium gonderi TaxID=77519 RepID=A0A1Y1JBY1_PLAGO|nr:ubiquitin [Plasmodium gonderi]GAW79750.1 ubiquitin [Plasmodium gonderi]
MEHHYVFVVYLFVVYICSSIKLNKYHNGRVSRINNLMNISSNIISQRVKKDKIEPIKGYNNVGMENTIEKGEINGKCNIMIRYYDKSDIFRNSFFLSMDDKNNVKDIKEQIENLHGIPTSFQQIIYENKSLNDDIVIQNLIKDKKIKLLNLNLVTILPHIFIFGEEKLVNGYKKENNKKVQKLQKKIKYWGYLTLLNEYKKLLHHLEEKNYVICQNDIIQSFKTFDKEFEKMLHDNRINLDKIKKEIDQLQNLSRKKLMLRLGVDYPLMSNLLINRIHELINFYYLGDIKSVLKFSLFFYILYKYANYPPNVKRLFLYLTFSFLLAPCKAVYMLFHFCFFFVPRGLLFRGFTNIMSAPYQQILKCQ